MTRTRPWRAIGAATALWLGLAATSAQAATASVCIGEDQAAAVMAVAMPDILTAIGKTCESRLPPGATLRAGLPALMTRYSAEATSAWAPAKDALIKIGGDSLKNVDADLLHPLIGTLIAPMVTKDVKPSDCPQIDRVAGLLAPLPAHNSAALVVAIYQLVSAEKKQSLPFTICPAHS